MDEMSIGCEPYDFLRSWATSESLILGFVFLDSLSVERVLGIRVLVLWEQEIVLWRAIMRNRFVCHHWCCGKAGEILFGDCDLGARFHNSFVFRGGFGRSRLFAWWRTLGFMKKKLPRPIMRPLALHRYFAVVSPALLHRPQVQGAGSGGGFGNKPPGQGQKWKQQGSFFSLRHQHSLGH